MTNKDIVDDFKKTLLSNLKIIATYAPIFIPKDKGDERILSIGMDMINCLIDDIQDPNTRLSDIVDVSKVLDEWTDDRSQLTSQYEKTVIDLIHDLEEKFEEPEDEE